MGKKYYGHRKSYRRNNIISLKKMTRFPRNEKQVFKMMTNIIKILIYVVIGTCKGIYEISKYVRKMINTNRLLREMGSGYNEIMEMIYTVTPRQFEILIAELFKNSGKYDKVEVTAKTCDYGRDCILTRKINGFEEVTFVEIKHFSKTNYVGRPIVQKLLGSCQMLGADKAIVVTTGKYNMNAYECEAMVDNLKLMDVTDIQKMILDLDASQISRVMMRTLNAS